jgi:hypothetical protein
MARATQEQIEQKLGELAEKVHLMEATVRGTHAVLRTIGYQGMLDYPPEQIDHRRAHELATKMLELAEDSLAHFVEGCISGELSDLQRGVV